MSTYHMASMHGKWSKQVNLPMGDKWGVPQGTSVADCLNWSHGSNLKPSPPTDYSRTEPDVQVVKEETRSSRTYISRTPVPPAADNRNWTVSNANTSPLRRAPAPTPHHAMHDEVVESSLIRERPLTPHKPTAEHLMDSGYDTWQGRVPTPDGFREGLVGTPVPVTQREVVERDVYETSRVQTQLETPPSFREPVTTRGSPKKSLRERPPTPPVSLKEYLRAKQRPPTPERFKQMASYVAEQKSTGTYPHYKPPPTPEDIEYLVHQLNTVNGRSATPGRSTTPTHRGMKPRYCVNGRKSIVPASTDDLLKEKAMIQSMRQHIYDTQREGNVSAKPPTGKSPYQYRAASSRKEDNQLVSYRASSARPNSASQFEYYKYKSSPNGKSVGFSEDDQYHSYDAYRGTPQPPRGAWNASKSDHFADWRDTTKAMASKGYEKPWQTKKYRNTRSRVDHGWGKSKPSPDVPGKVSVELDCPENKDMMVSVRVKNTPVPVY